MSLCRNGFYFFQQPEKNHDGEIRRRVTGRETRGKEHNGYKAEAMSPVS